MRLPMGSPPALVPAVLDLLSGANDDIRVDVHRLLAGERVLQVAERLRIDLWRLNNGHTVLADVYRGAAAVPRVRILGQHRELHPNLHPKAVVFGAIAEAPQEHDAQPKLK